MVKVGIFSSNRFKTKLFLEKFMDDYKDDLISAEITSSMWAKFNYIGDEHVLYIWVNTANDNSMRGIRVDHAVFDSDMTIGEYNEIMDRNIITGGELEHMKEF